MYTRVNCVDCTNTFFFFFLLTWTNLIFLSPQPTNQPTICYIIITCIMQMWMADDLILSSRYRAEILWRQSASENAEPRTPKYTEEDRDVSQFLPITSPSSRRWHAGHGKNVYFSFFPDRKSSSLAIFQHPAKRVNNDQHHWFARLNDSPFWGGFWFISDLISIGTRKKNRRKTRRKTSFSPCDRLAWVKSICLAGKEKKKFSRFSFSYLLAGGGIHTDTCAAAWMDGCDA